MVDDATKKAHISRGKEKQLSAFAPPATETWQAHHK